MFLAPNFQPRSCLVKSKSMFGAADKAKKEGRCWIGVDYKFWSIVSLKQKNLAASEIP